MTSLPAYILAGGRSRRFGSDKARALLEGKPLIRRLADRLKPEATRVVAVADTVGKYDDLGVRTLADHRPGCGPLAGLERALQDLEGHEPWLLLVSVDQIVFEWTWIHDLLRHAREPTQAVAFRGERWEPMCALYHRSILPTVTEAISAGSGSAWRLLESVTNHALPLPISWPANAHVNTISQLRQHER